MSERLVNTFETGKRYIRKYADGHIEIGLTPRTANPKEWDSETDKIIIPADPETKTEAYCGKLDISMLAELQGKQVEIFSADSKEVYEKRLTELKLVEAVPVKEDVEIKR